MNSSKVTAIDSSQSARSDETDTAWNVEALRAVWARQQSQVSERICVLEKALAALADDRLEAGLRCEAERIAHTLAGSLGMFGFVNASNAARKIEQALADPEPQCVPGLAELLEQLQAGVNGPVALHSDLEDCKLRGFPSKTADSGILAAGAPESSHCKYGP